MPLIWAIIGYRGELDDHLAAPVGRRVELSDDGLVLRSGSGKYVKAVEHAHTVDGDVEDPLARRGPITFGEVQPDPVSGAGRQVGDGISRVPVTVVLIDGLGRGIGQAAHINRRGRGRSRPAGEIRVRAEPTRRAAARVHRHAAGDHGGFGGVGGFPGGKDGGNDIVINRVIDQSRVRVVCCRDASGYGRVRPAADRRALDIVTDGTRNGVPAQYGLPVARHGVQSHAAPAGKV